MKGVVFGGTAALMVLFTVMFVFGNQSTQVPPIQQSEMQTEDSKTRRTPSPPAASAPKLESMSPSPAGSIVTAREETKLTEPLPKLKGKFLENLQTSEQTVRMLNQCPTNRRLPFIATETFDAFVARCFDALSNAVVKKRPILHLIDNFDTVWENHSGLRGGFWAEFGVFQGNTLKLASDALVNNKTLRQQNKFKGVVAGFDSFAGLPVEWRKGFGAGEFGAKQYGNLREKVQDMVSCKEKELSDCANPENRDTVELYKGWFQNTISEFKERHPRMPASFIHHDGDLFVSTAITFSMLADRIVPGTIMCFDELQGYFGFEQHEILALYLWMHHVEATLCALAVHSKIEGTLRQPRPPGRKGGKRANADEPPELQSSCFQVLSLKAVS